jgi:hypothetical protein
MSLSFYLAYIYYRRLFAKGDLLTIIVLIGLMGGVLYALYEHYDLWKWTIIFFPLATLSHHNSREDLSLLKYHSQYRKILIGEYFVENIPFLFLLLLKMDFLLAGGYALGIGLMAFLPQKDFVLPYPFSLSDPLWHTTFRKYKLLYALPILIVLIGIAIAYKNTNLALFALGITGLISSMPYFEREHIAHICISSFQGKDYLQHQLITGFKNSLILFSPIYLAYFIGFGWESISLLPLFLGIPMVGILSKYAFFDQPLTQSFAWVGILLGAPYFFPILALPYLYYRALKNLQKYPYVTDKNSRKKLF